MWLLILVCFRFFKINMSSSVNLCCKLKRTWEFYEGWTDKSKAITYLSIRMFTYLTKHLFYMVSCNSNYLHENKSLDFLHIFLNFLDQSIVQIKRIFDFLFLCISRYTWFTMETLEETWEGLEKIIQVCPCHGNK